MTVSNLNDFVIFILTNRRPDKVITYNRLRNHGYTGKIRLLVDDLDPTKDLYLKHYGDEVIIFDKKEIASFSDRGDNFPGLQTITHARNVTFRVASELGVKYFMHLDDDNTSFGFRFDNNFKFKNKKINCLDNVLLALLRFFITSGATSVAMSQGGDFLGGGAGGTAKSINLHRKCMNSFICCTERPFKFLGRLNEDVNTYTRMGSTGSLFFTVFQVSLSQIETQSSSGGMTEVYKETGTYVKSFYSIMYHPSSVKIKQMACKNPRLHHSIAWKHTTPKILRESTQRW